MSHSMASASCLRNQSVCRPSCLGRLLLCDTARVSGAGRAVLRLPLRVSPPPDPRQQTRRQVCPVHRLPMRPRPRDPADISSVQRSKQGALPHGRSSNHNIEWKSWAARCGWRGWCRGGWSGAGGCRDYVKRNNIFSLERQRSQQNNDGTLSQQQLLARSEKNWLGASQAKCVTHP
eukprot:3802677-Rhodomonas_salina.3